MKRLLFGVLLALLIALPLGLAVLVWLAVQDRPLVAEKVVLDATDIERAKLLINRNNPRAMRPGILRSMVLPQQDVSLATAYLASRFARGSARVILQNGAAVVRATLTLPSNPLGQYLNLELVLTESATLPRVESAHVGRVSLPPFVCNWVLDRTLAHLQQHADYSAAADVIRRVHIRNGLLNVMFQWNEAAASQIKATLVPPQDQERWKAHQERLVELTSRGSAMTARIPMEQLLTALMQLAAQRSGAGQAAAENRAALIVLAFYINGKGLAALVPDARAWPVPPSAPSPWAAAPTSRSISRSRRRWRPRPAAPCPTPWGSTRRSMIRAWGAAFRSVTSQPTGPARVLAISPPAPWRVPRGCTSRLPTDLPKPTCCPRGRTCPSS